MNLLDHHHPPAKKAVQWGSFHSQWLTTLANDLNRRLPPRYFADAGFRLGIEVDVGAVEWLRDADGAPVHWHPGWTPPAATATIPFALATDELEVLVYGDTNEGRRLVGAIEFVSPANKDRPESRGQFVAKCRDYLGHGTGVVLVDAVTDKHFNLHNDLMGALGRSGERLDGHLYVAAYRPTGRNEDGRLDLWLHPLTVGGPLPTVPFWLYGGLCVPADLQATYDQVCVDVRMPERLGLLGVANGTH